MMRVFEPLTSRGPGVVLATETDYLEVLNRLLASARQSVDLLAFSFAVGSADGHLAFKSRAFGVMERLKELPARGIRTRVFLEGRRDTAARNRVTGTHLAKAGIKVRYGATHAKGVAVDGRYLLLGSTNLTDQSLLKNFETNLLLDHRPAVKQFARYFDHYWEGGSHGELQTRSPLLADGAWLAALLKMVGGARREIDFSIYFFDQTDVKEALIRAHERGVRVRGQVHTHRSFGLDDVRRTRATVRALREAGLGDLHFASPTRFTHSKYLIADRTDVMIGTGNWLDRDVTTHPQLYVRLRHAPLGRALNQHLRAQITRASP